MSALSGKIALVTGASRGIGFAIASLLAREGATVIITGRDQHRLKQAAGTAGAVAMRCDHTQAGQVEDLCRQIREKYSRLDILINNAGMAHALANVEELDPQVWREVIDGNLTSTFLTCHYALPLMAAGAVIVNNLSVAARSTFAGMSAYSAAKHGALGLTNTMREELRPRGIRVVALLPGATSTDIWNQFWGEAPRNKMMSAESVADVVLRAVTLPPETSLDEIALTPSGGSL